MTLVTYLLDTKLLRKTNASKKPCIVILEHLPRDSRYSIATWESKKTNSLPSSSKVNRLEQKEQPICSVCLPHKSVRGSTTSHRYLADHKWEYQNIFCLELLNNTEYSHKGSPNRKHFTKTA